MDNLPRCIRTGQQRQEGAFQVACDSHIPVYLDQETVLTFKSNKLFSLYRFLQIVCVQYCAEWVLICASEAFADCYNKY